MRASSRPGTVKIALCGIKHAFAYTRQVTKSLPSDFCREAEERIGAWMRGLRTDILRERHQTREHEDAIVAAIVQVLPLFETLASVREASCLLNSLSASARRGEAGRRARPSQYTRVRDYVMLEVARANAQRSGAILRMTTTEFDSATAFGPSSIIHVSSHKTSASFGSARIVVSAESNRLMKAFDTVRNLAVENANRQATFFCTVAGKRLHACQMTNAFTYAYRRDGIVVHDHKGKPCRITATRLRKAHVTCARGADRLDQNMFDMARHMQHGLHTQQAYYDAADRDRISVVVHDRIMEDSFRRARPVATCLSVPVVPVESHRPPPNHAENSVADAEATDSEDGEATDAVNAREEAAAYECSLLIRWFGGAWNVCGEVQRDPCRPGPPARPWALGADVAVRSEKNNSKRWNTRLVCRRRAQPSARINVHCRTHEYLERIRQFGVTPRATPVSVSVSVLRRRL